MRKSFQQLVDEQGNNLAEILQCGGVTPDVHVDTAIELDWIGAMSDAQADLVLYARHTSPSDRLYRRRMLRQTLARMVAICDAWERRVE